LTAFQTTRWSLILAAREPGAEAGAALNDLCRNYRPAVLSYLRRRCGNRDRAEDLTQGFFTRFLEYRYHEIADPARGRFRVFLGAALNNYLASRAEHDLAAKRGGGMAAVELDEDRMAGATRDSPEHAFDLAWALTVLDQAMAALEAEAVANGKGAMFARLREFLTENPDPADYALAATELGMRQNTLAVSVHRMRERLRAKVREVLADTVLDPAEVDDELRTLRRVLGSVGA
jgi:DNA-directed RNA polymerase specialized sigma24 family protein